MQETVFIEDEAAMEHVGAVLLTAMQHTGVVHLQGDLGMGKTTLSRGLLRAAGHTGSVKSPTYTLVEPYETDVGMVYHFDLYRLLDPEELEYLGIRDYFTPDSLALIEWPDKGEGLLPAPDIELKLMPQAHGRVLSWHAHSVHGSVAAAKLHEQLRC